MQRSKGSISRGISKCLRVGRSQDNGAIKQRDCLVETLLRPHPVIRQCLEQKIECVQVFWSLAASASDLGSAKFGFDCTDQALRNAVLKLEYLVQGPIVLVCPQMIPGSGLNQLRCHSNAATGFTNTTFHAVTHTQFLADGSDVVIPTAEGKGRVSRDDEEPRDTV